jgi:(1->4)-alpha-D-glucan 1-alpha-D-glucosylmutase
MTWLQDIVPNHMAYDSSNPWIKDVLERGRSSTYYSYFDIFPHPVGEMGDRLMAPFLGGTVAMCLRKGELRLDLADGRYIVRYFDRQYPVALGLHDWVAGRADLINADPLLMETLLLRQHYLLTPASLAASQINYRRFFTINGLICLRMEDEKVFDAYHERIRHWYQQGWIQGLRIDHIDGMADPKGYCQRLRDRFGKDCYTIAEKILSGDELLREDWRLDGTTGYDFLSFAGQLLTDAEGSRQLLEFYRRHIVDLPEYPDVAFEKKYSFLLAYMRGELDQLLQPLAPLQDYDRLKEALAALMAAFPVYRAYPDDQLSQADKEIFSAAIMRARQLRPGYGPELLYLETLLSTDSPFRSRLMQFTGPLAAKGVEDTTFYVYNPYIALNEVGDSPARAGMSIEDFHRKMAYRQQHFPHTLNATSTHDTKRGEDARIRLQLLSARPQEWIDAVMRWKETSHASISPNDEYLIYQALLGGFPEDGVVTDQFRERFSGYLTKALREAKTRTNYDSPDEAYEKECQEFAKTILTDGSPFLQAFVPFAASVIRQSFAYSLSLLLIKLTAPGIPDIYQGAELWDTSFVDPDNRRAIDYPLRMGLLDQLVAEETKGPEAALRYARAHREKGAEKLFTLYRVLNFRREHPRLFAEGEYIPVQAGEPCLAFARRHEKDWTLTVVPLIRRTTIPATLSLQLPPGAPTEWRDVFTGKMYKSVQTLQLKSGDYPVALLTGRGQ